MLVALFVFWILSLFQFALAKEEVVCTGKYYYDVDYMEYTLHTHYPSERRCDYLNGSYSVNGWISFPGRIPKSLYPVKVVTDFLSLQAHGLRKAPPFTQLVEIGSLLIQGTRYSSLNTLKKLEKVKNLLSLDQNDDLHKVSLPNLIELGRLDITQSLITSIDFPKVKEVKSISIHYDNRLKSLSGLRNLEIIKEDLDLNEVKLTSLGLKGLKRIDGNFKLREFYKGSVEPNRKLVIDIHNALNIGKDLIASYNRFNVYFISYDGPTNTTGSIIIRGNEVLTDFSKFIVGGIGSSIIVDSNAAQVKMFDVSKIAKQTGSVIFRNNKNLIHPIFALLETIGGNFTVPQSTKAGVIEMAEFPMLKRVNGTVIVEGVNQTTSLEMLSSVDFIGSMNIVNNANLTSLKGISKFTSFDYLSIASNPNLGSLAEFSNLLQVDNNLEIINNDNIQSIDGFENVKGIGNLTISRNKNLLSIYGLTKLTRLGELRIDFANQPNVKTLKIGKKDSNLGKPKVLIANYKFATYLTLQQIKKFLTPICSSINITESVITCP